MKISTPHPEQRGRHQAPPGADSAATQAAIARGMATLAAYALALAWATQRTLRKTLD